MNFINKIRKVRDNDNIKIDKYEGILYFFNPYSSLYELYITRDIIGCWFDSEWKEKDSNIQYMKYIIDMFY